MPLFLDDTGIYGNTTKTLPAPAPLGFILSGSSVMQVGNGTAVAPSVAFTNSPTTGLFRKTADSVGFSAAGVEIGSFTSAGAWTLGSVASAGLTHTIRTGASTLLDVRSANGSNTRIALSDGVNNDFYLRRNAGASASFDILSDAVILASSTQTGAWTLGGGASAGPLFSHNLSVYANTSSAAGGRGIVVGFNSSNTPVTLSVAQSNGFPYLGVNTLQTAGNDNQTYAITSSIGAGRFALNTGTTTTFAWDVAGSGTAGNTITWIRAGTIDNTGAWTFGPQADVNTRHWMPFGAAGTTQTVLKIGGQTIGSGAGIEIGSQNLNSGSGSLALVSSQAIFGNRFSFGYGGIVSGLPATVVGFFDGTGAWTFGPAAGAAVHTIQSPGNGAGTAALHVRKQGVAINISGNSYIECYAASNGYDGWLGVSGTTLQVNDASDSRKKENVRPANYGLNEILSLNPVIYDWKQEFGGQTDIKGFLAHEVENVLPECVSTQDDSESGGFVDSRFLGTAGMMPVLVKAIQELSAQNTALSARLAALEGAATP